MRKAGHILSVIDEADIVVFLDADAFVVDANLPFTTLLQKWGFLNPRALFLAASDPSDPNDTESTHNKLVRA